MKNTSLAFLACTVLTINLMSCSKDDDPSPLVNPVIGNWNSDGSEFFSISVDGDQISLLDFGIEILKLNEQTAETGAKEYFQHYVFGPIAMDEASITLEAQGAFSASLQNDQTQGEWKLLNDRTVLHLIPNGPEAQIYDFEILKLNSSELELKKSISISFIGDESESHQVDVFIKLVK